jgi:hypothetical protein
MQKMQFKLRFTPTALEQLVHLESDSSSKGILRQVRKTLGYLETNLRSKSLQTHKFESLTKRYGKEVFEAYAQNEAWGAYRVFWHYGDDELDKDGNRIPIIIVIAIISHP